MTGTRLFALFVDLNSGEIQSVNPAILWDLQENGNIVLSGHNDVYGEIFRYLDRLRPGDSVILFTSRRQYTYIIIGTQMVKPTAVEVMASTPDARVTLISCHPYLVDIHRIVISAVLQSQ